MAYIREPIEYDAAVVEEEIRDQLTLQIPGLVVAPGTLLDYLVRVLAPVISENRQLLTEVLADIFQYYGEKILRIPRRQATSASGSVDIVIAHSNGYTIPAGTEMTLTGGDGAPHMFATTLQVVIPNGSNTATGVGIQAVEQGADGTGLSGEAVVEQPDLTSIDSVTALSATVGGEDPEDIEEYLDRLNDTTALLAFTLVIPEDFERDARNQPGIDRALCIPLYDAASGTANVGGHFTVAVESGGNDPGDPIRTALAFRQQALVPPLVTVHVVGPTPNDVDVVFSGVAEPGWDPDDVAARAETAVLEFLNPARWGLPRTGDRPLWQPSSIVRFQDVSAVLNNVVGFDHWTSLTINDGTADVPLNGVAPLPSRLSTASGTVAAAA